MDSERTYASLDQKNSALNRLKGRGAVSNVSGRYETHARETFHDGWCEDEMFADRISTELFTETPRKIITRNSSPDIPFDRSINPYKGCEHGCIYCFARPTHSYMGLSAGLDFETKIFTKPNAAELLRKELSSPRYKVAPIAIGTNTDPYQPIEKEQQITRQVLEVLSEFNHPVTVLTKSRMIVRDIDILAPMAEKGLVKTALSITTLDHKLANVMEPRASSPQRRLDAVRMLSEAGIPVGMMFAPVIPAINDHEMERILAASAHAGATSAGYILLRLPRELDGLFREWLHTHFPDRASRVMNRLLQMRAGKANDPRFGHRMKGHGVEADLLKARFFKLAKRLGLSSGGFRKEGTGHSNNDMNIHDFIAATRPTSAKPVKQQLDLFSEAG